MHSVFSRKDFRIMNFDTVKNDFCNIGMKNTKLRMNKYALIDERAKILRSMLDVAYATICSKTYKGESKLKSADSEISFIHNLLYECKEKKLTFGKAYDLKNRIGKNFLFVEFEEIQFSWEIENELFDLPLYRGVINYSSSSTLEKLEYLILRLYPSIDKVTWQSQIPLPNKYIFPDDLVFTNAESIGRKY